MEIKIRIFLIIINFQNYFLNKIMKQKYCQIYKKNTEIFKTNNNNLYKTINNQYRNKRIKS